MTKEQKPFGIQLSRTEWPLPIKTEFSGRYVDLVPLAVEHTDRLWPAVDAGRESFTYLRYGPFAQAADLHSLLGDLSQRSDQPFWTVIPNGGVPQGWLSLCDVSPKDGSIEIGSIWFSPELQGTREAREAIFLLMCHAMDDLGYERLVWRCQAQNAKSFKAANNLGFTYEGTWRRAVVIDSWQRDVAWFSILKDEWPGRKAAFHEWLAADNFDPSGRQIARLGEIAAAL